MAYTISKTDGSVLTTIADGTVDTTTNLTLIGKNYAGYGDFLNENLIRLLENASSTKAPPAPITGQLWWDKANFLLKVYTGTDFKTVSSSTVSNTAPTNAVIGDLWWDSANGQLNVYNGTSGWTLIGPAFTTTTGTSGTQVSTIIDNLGVGHVVVNIYVQNTLVAIISKDPLYTPQTTITGFTSIKPGFNLTSTGVVSDIRYNGTATDSDRLGGATAANFARLDTPAVHTSTISVTNNSGLTIGTANNYSQTIVGNTVTLTNNINNANIAIKANVGGTLTTAFLIDGTTGLTYVTAEPQNNLGVATKAYVDAATGGGNVSLLRDGTRSITGTLVPDTNGSRNLGSVSNKFGNIYANYLIGTSIQAQYADLAERFEADMPYEAGTVVALGGIKEVTAAAEELSEDVFGVVSTKAAYLMNAAAGSDATHPAIAVNGRVPVRVIGRINKGDRLVAAGNGLARAGNRNEISSFNVIGRALETKTTDGEGTILAIVKLNS